MNTLTTDDLKLIAEAMGKEIVYEDKGEIAVRDKEMIDLWSPDEFADQCLEVLEWLIDQKGKKRIDLKEIFIGLSEYYYQFYDFKLAVCLEAVEWIKQSKR